MKTMTKTILIIVPSMFFSATDTPINAILTTARNAHSNRSHLIRFICLHPFYRVNISLQKNNRLLKGIVI